MLFNSVTYLVFLALVVLVFWCMPARAKRWLILAASLAFYGFWRVEFLLLISFSAFVDYFFSLRIYDETDPRRRKLWLWCSLSINIGLLVYFKYTYFIVDNASRASEALGRDWKLSVGDIVLPLGISFYTFLSISYTLDVYRRLFEPIRNFGIYLTYVMFWPHMIAGPILRAHELIPQLVRTPHFNIDRVTEGLTKIVCGLFLKVALADQLAPWVDEAYSAVPRAVGGLDVWTMAFGFGLQIYFDFAGYSLIAIGSALLVGVRFPENFNWPYVATSPRDFWKRWHITLSAWIRDYLYFPLSGQRFRDSSEGGIDIETNQRKASFLRLTLALFLTWFIMGLWHGAGWRFAFWGVWHAAIIVAYRISKGWFTSIPARARAILGWMITLPIVMLGWIPFRSESLGHAMQLYGRLLDPSSYHSLAFRENFYLLVFLLMLGMLLSWLVVHSRMVLSARLGYRVLGQALSLSVMIFVVFIFLRPVSQFIYFQF